MTPQSGSRSRLRRRARGRKSATSSPRCNARTPARHSGRAGIGRRQTVRGVFSATQIARQLGVAFTTRRDRAHLLGVEAPARALKPHDGPHGRFDSAWGLFYTGSRIRFSLKTHGRASRLPASAGPDHTSDRAGVRACNSKDRNTHANLKAAFAGESQANRRYLYFAPKPTSRTNASRGVPFDRGRRDRARSRTISSISSLRDPAPISRSAARAIT